MQEMKNVTVELCADDWELLDRLAGERGIVVDQLIAEMMGAAVSRKKTIHALDGILNELLSNHEIPMPECRFLACNAVEAAKNAINSGRSAELLGLLQGSGFVPTGLED